MTPEKANLYADLFVRALSADSETRPDPGLFVFRGWDLIRRLGPADTGLHRSPQKHGQEAA